MNQINILYQLQYNLNQFLYFSSLCNKTMPSFPPQDQNCDQNSIKNVDQVNSVKIQNTQSDQSQFIQEVKNPNRRSWTKEEDEKILNIIDALQLNQYKKIPYRIIAKYFENRTSKQIRQRYLNKLDKTILKSPFSKEQDDIICDFFIQKGAQWKKLSMILKGRTSTALKNRFNSKLKHKIERRKKLKRANERKLNKLNGDQLLNQRTKQIESEKKQQQR